MARRSGLGKGLGALIPEGSAAADGTDDSGGPLRQVAVGSIRPNRFQPRQTFTEESLETLAASIKEMGVLQPLILRPVSGSPGEFELIAGERRLRASVKAGLETVPALIQDDANDRLSLEQAVVENLHREDLNALEEAAAYQQLVDDFDMTHDQVATRVGKSRATVTNTLRLLHLSEPAQIALANGSITAGHARALLGLVDPVVQAEMVKRVVQGDMTVRATEAAVRDELAEKVPAHISPINPPSTGVTQLRPVPDASIAELEHLLEDYLDTRVHVDLKGRNGRIVIDFADLDDLERIYLVISKVR